MNQIISRMPAPVKRAGANRYLLYTLLSFGGTVILVRAFLALTGYPQIGGTTLHIAHVLWGGLFLFGASILPLIFANRWVYIIGGVLGGIGVGLFIDEVGKFITRTNNYFYPAAAPIIYAFFLLTVLLYARVRRVPSTDSRAGLYRALDGMEEVLDHDLSEREREELVAQLRQVSQDDTQPDLQRLAIVLLDFVSSETLKSVPESPRLWQRAYEWLQGLEARWIDRRYFKLALVSSLALLGLLSLANLASWMLYMIPSVPAHIRPELDALTGRVLVTSSPFWLIARVALEAVVGVAFLAGAQFLAAGKEPRGVAFAYYGLLVSLTTVNLLVFYLDQFRALSTTMIQFVLLLGLAYYRQRYLEATTPERARHHEGDHYRGRDRRADGSHRHGASGP